VSFLDVVFGAPPEAPEEEDVDQLEGRNLGLHVRECTRRYNDLNANIHKTAVEIYGTRRLLIIIIAILIANKVIDVSLLTGLFAQ
jgi:predicted aspartyl protease